MKVKNFNIKKMVLAALCLSLGMVLPFLTSQIKEIGDTLLPMHWAVMFCGLFCGYGYGMTVGLILPIFRSICFGMPPLYPNSIWMALELATYGFTIGFLNCNLKFKKFRVMVSLIISMIMGRIVWGIAKAILLGVAGKGFTLYMFFTGGFVDALPGIILQLILIPIIFKIAQQINFRGDNTL